MSKEHHHRQKKPLDYFEAQIDSFESIRHVLGGAVAHMLISILGERKYHRLRRRLNGKRRHS